jgi:hypothetical protein
MAYSNQQLNVYPASPISFDNPDPGASSNVNLNSAADNAPNGEATQDSQVYPFKMVTTAGVRFNNPA